MLSSGARHGAARLLPSVKHRVELGTSSIKRVLAAYSVLAGRGSSDTLSNNATLPFRIQRGLATRAVAKPKAHTGRPKAVRPRASKTPASNARTLLAKAKAANPKTKTAAKRKPGLKPKLKPKKVALTPEAKEKELIKTLKKTALAPPKKLPYSAFTVVNVEQSKVKGGLASAEASAKYKNFTPSEREHYNHIAQQNSELNKTEYEKWIRSYHPSEIRKANNARNQLTRLGVKGYRCSLLDERVPKRPAAPHALFLKERWDSGEMAGIKAHDCTKLIIREWRELPESEKQKYTAAREELMKHYVAQMTSLGMEVNRTISPTAKETAV